MQTKLAASFVIPDPVYRGAVRLTPLSAYDELAAVCQPKTELVLEGGAA
jgi:hypothetical protein